MITQKQVKELFSYKDGKLIRKVTVAYNAKKGFEFGCDSSDGYLRGGICGKTYLIHRVVFLWHHGYLPEFLDHVDGNKQNNKIENLREASKSENSCNKVMQSNNTSGVKGVYWNKKQKSWHCAIENNKKRYFVGSFKDLNQAKNKMAQVRSKIHKEFANHG